MNMLSSRLVFSDKIIILLLQLRKKIAITFKHAKRACKIR